MYDDVKPPAQSTASTSCSGDLSKDCEIRLLGAWLASAEHAPKLAEPLRLIARSFQPFQLLQYNSGSAANYKAKWHLH